MRVEGWMSGAVYVRPTWVYEKPNVRREEITWHDGWELPRHVGRRKRLPSLDEQERRQ